jgi:hypothetical protein
MRAVENMVFVRIQTQVVDSTTDAPVRETPALYYRLA